MLIITGIYAIYAILCRNVIISYYNPGQNTMNKIDKSSKIGQDKESLTSTFACFLTAVTKV